MQAVCDHEQKFLNVVVKWPGSTHDSFILKNSDVYEAFETAKFNGIILGDSGYPLRKWLMTPVSDPESPAEMSYNVCSFFSHYKNYFNNKNYFN